MKRDIFYLSVLTILIICATTFAAGIETIGVGARATAMGGSYRAVADDWSAMYWNPAGLAFTPGWNIGFHGAYVTPKATFTAGPSHYYNTSGGSDFKPFSAAYQTERPNESNSLFVPAAGVSYKRDKWAFGIGVWAPMGWGAKWDVLRTASNNSGYVPGVPYDTYNAAYPKHEYESDIRVVDIHPTIAYQINDRLSVGLGVSFVLGDFAIRQPAFLQNPYLYEQDIYNLLQSLTPQSQLAILEQMRKSPFDHLITEAEMKSSGQTYGANMGLIYKPSESLSLGASIQYYGTLEASGDYSQITYFGDAPRYQELSQFYSDTLFSKLHDNGALSDEEYLIVSQYYSGDVVPRIETEATATIPLPLKAGIGLSYSGFRNWLLALDFSYTQWSVWDVIKIAETDGPAISELVQNWKDTFKVSMGFEYTAGTVKLRGGCGFDTRAAVDESVSPTIPDIGDRYNLSLGISAPVGPLVLAVNYEGIFIPDKEITDWVYDDMTVTQNVAGFYTMGANSLMIGIDYAF